MKKNLFPLLLLLILIFSACQEKIDIDKEKLAIINVLNEESQAYLDRNYELIASYWMQDESTSRLFVDSTGYYFINWETISKDLKTELENDSIWLAAKDLKYEKSDFNINVFPDCAWATYNEKFTGIYKDEPFKSDAIHLTVLEKKEGQWKIACFVSVN
jgi:hypothetical protein